MMINCKMGEFKIDKLYTVLLSYNMFKIKVNINYV